MDPGTPSPILRPSPGGLPDELRRAAEHVARTLREAGHQAWLVGGCVRDLALGRTPKDVDMVTDARPERIEELFPRTLGVGRAFGTILVHVELRGAERGSGGGERGGERTRVDVEVTTFRAEADYRDGRRPDVLTYAPSAGIDATRRDFTCNALYLDPLDGELFDPTGGLADLERGLLRTVGEARERFREDGLRLWRMARFQASLDLAPAPDLHDAARAERASLRGVSPERVHAELLRILGAPHARVGLEVVEACGLWPAGWEAWLEENPAEVRLARIRRLPRLHPEFRHEAGMAALLGPADCWDLEPRPEPELARSLEPLERLHPSRRELRLTLDLLQGLGELGACLARGRRSLRLRFLRREDHRAVVALALSPDPDEAPDAGLRSAAAGLLREGEALGPGELHAEPWIRSADLVRLGVPRGPDFGRLLRETEDGQLDGRWDTREEALAWLASQLDA